MLNNKTVLITGGTGSFGKRFAQRIFANYSPKKVIIYSRDELKQFEMAKAFSESKFPAIRYFLGATRRGRCNTRCGAKACASGGV
jgi:UDP-N-acetylglucosamine 4,6-dehydratase